MEMHSRSRVERVSPCILWPCDPRGRVWRGVSAWTPDMLPSVQVLEVVHPGDSGCVILGTWSREVCHPIDCGNVIQIQNGEGVTMETVKV